MSIEPFNKLVKLTARAFYDDYTAQGENQPRSGRSDNRGIAVVVLDALTRRPWVREEDLAKDLKLHLKQLRRTLQFFEEEKLVTRENKKEKVKGAKGHNAAVAATADNLHERGEEKNKVLTHTYCCLDYSQIHDVVRYRLHRMKKKLKDELDNKTTVQEYVCPKCGKRYNALDAIRLISFEDDSFHCESCNTELLAESDKLASQQQDIGDGDENARRRRLEKVRDLLQKLEVELKPLIDQLGRVKDLEAPDYGTYDAWRNRANAAHAPDSDPNANDSNTYGQSGTPMPFLGETKVEVAFSGVEEKGEIKSENAPMKVLPPWMIKEGMNLTNEQRGGVKQESSKMEEGTSMDLKDEKKLTSQQDDDVKNLQDEYFKAYYAALLQRQKEQEEEATKKEQQDLSNSSASADVDTSNSRKRHRGDDVEWEQTPTAGGFAGETFRVDLNVEAAEPSGDDDEDGIDWEEG